MKELGLRIHICLNITIIVTKLKNIDHKINLK